MWAHLWPTPARYNLISGHWLTNRIFSPLPASDAIKSQIKCMFKYCTVYIQWPPKSTLSLSGKGHLIPLCSGRLDMKIRIKAWRLITVSLGSCPHCYPSKVNLVGTNAQNCLKWTAVNEVCEKSPSRGRHAPLGPRWSWTAAFAFLFKVYEYWTFHMCQIEPKCTKCHPAHPDSAATKRVLREMTWTV